MCLTITSYCGFSPGMIGVIITPWVASPRCWFTGKLFRQHASWTQQLFAFYRHIRKAKQNFKFGKKDSPHRHKHNFSDSSSSSSFSPGLIGVMVTPWAATPRFVTTGKLFRQHASWTQQLLAFYRHIRKAKQNFYCGKKNSPHRHKYIFSNYSSWSTYAMSQVKQIETLALGLQVCICVLTLEESPYGFPR